MEIKTKKGSKQDSDNAVIVFIRKPEIGKVKTRLAADVGDQEALNIYISLQRHTDLVASQADAACYLFYAGEVVQQDEWSNERYTKLLQEGDDLGERLINAFDLVLSRHKHVVVIGSDCAQLRTSHINQGLASLAENDVVIGPTYDGGYYLLGINNMHAQFFTDMPWSTEEVAEITINRAEDSQLILTIGLIGKRMGGNIS